MRKSLLAILSFAFFAALIGDGLAACACGGVGDAGPLAASAAPGQMHGQMGHAQARPAATGEMAQDMPAHKMAPCDGSACAACGEIGCADCAAPTLAGAPASIPVLGAICAAAPNATPAALPPTTAPPNDFFTAAKNAGRAWPTWSMNAPSLFHQHTLLLI